MSLSASPIWAKLEHVPLTPQEALVEANRCLFCFDAPCTVACPTHIDVPRFIKKIASGNLRGSADTILDANILGLSCSRVCPVDVLCEGACVMHRYNRQPIEIGRLQRHAMDSFYAAGAKLRWATPEPKAKRVACVGAGPASLCLCSRAAAAGFPGHDLRGQDVLGGLNTYGVAEYKFHPSDSFEKWSSSAPWEWNFAPARRWASSYRWSGWKRSSMRSSSASVSVPQKN